MSEPLLYRGTSSGWAGNPVLRSLRITPTTADPLIAALFATECQRFGRGIILACPLSAVAGLIGTPNVLAEIENEVVVNLAPVEFAERFAQWTIRIEEAAAVLNSLGLKVPAVIGDKRMLNDLLTESARLSATEIAEFDRRLIWKAIA